MFFSVIIPCYNSLSYLHNAISSLEQQDYKEFEVIFIDDCSVDGTYNYLLDLKDTSLLCITVLKNEHNTGPGLSKERGVKNATGTYIVFMDSDDWYEPTFFTSLYDHLIINQDDIVFFNAYRVHSNGCKNLINNSESFSNCIHISDFIANSKGCLPYICSKSDLWHDIHLPLIYNAEDIAVIPVLISKAKSVSVLPKPLYNYLYRESSLSNTPNKNVYLSFLKSFEFTQNSILGFDDEIEFHGIKTVLYGAVLNALKANVKYNVISDFVIEFEKNYPIWHSNKYIDNLPSSKRFFLKLVHAKMFAILSFYVSMHHFALKYLKL